MYRNATYNIVNENLDLETIHHETSAKQVKLFDEKMKEIGNLEGVLNGKDTGQAEVDILTMKYSGSHIVRKMKNPPKPIGNITILQSLAVGSLGSPDFVHFTLTYPSGEVFNATVVGSKSSGWSSGGQALKESLDLTNTEVAANKTAIAANEKILSTLKISHEKLSSDFTGHNHDSSYLKLSGGTVTGDIGLRHGGSFKFVSAQGDKKDFATYSVANGAVLGDATVSLEIKSKNEIKHNGKKLWSEVNHGKGSGLDADKIHGVSGNDIAQLTKLNRFKQETYIDNGKSLSFQSSGAISGIYWLNDNGATRSSIRSTSDGSIQFYGTGGASSTKVDGSGNIVSSKALYFNSSLGENKIVYQLSGTDKGMGMYRNKNSQYLGFYDWNKSKRLGYFDHVNGNLYLDESPSIKGRKLHLQGSTPTGSHKVGDIWIS